MAENTDILLGYFDSLLSTGGLTLPDEIPDFCDEELSSDPVNSSAEVLITPCDTIAIGYRLIPLYAPIIQRTAAANMITALELLSLTARLSPGKVRQQILGVCRGVLHG